MKIIISTVLLAIICVLVVHSTASAASANRLKRFANFDQVMPSTIEKCLMACTLCSLPENENIAELLSKDVANEEAANDSVELMCANQCLTRKNFLDVALELMQRGADKSFLKCFLVSSKKRMFF